MLDFDSILNFQYIFFVNRTESRCLRIPFEELHPKLKGIERINAESELCEAMQHSHKSLPFVTSNVHRAIASRLDDPDFIEITEQLEAECEKNEGEGGSLGTEHVFVYVVLLKEGI